jgi:uncharacterized lipoprotein
MKAAQRAQAGVLLAIGLAGCHSPSKEEQMQAAQDPLFKEAMALQQCELKAGYTSQQCAAQRKAYEDHFAAFKGSYSR